MVLNQFDWVLTVSELSGFWRS